MSGSVADEDAVAQLERWQLFGAVWRVIARTEDEVTISLRRCDDGEEVERITSRDATLLRWLGDRASSET